MKAASAISLSVSGLQALRASRRVRDFLGAYVSVGDWDGACTNDGWRVLADNAPEALGAVLDSLDPSHAEGIPSMASMAPADAFRAFVQYVEHQDCGLSTHALPPDPFSADGSGWEAVTLYMAHAVAALQTSFPGAEGCGIDLDADKYTAEPTLEEVQMVVGYMGDRAIKVTDVSEDLSAVASMWRSGYLLVLVTNFLGGLCLLLWTLFQPTEVYSRLLDEGNEDKYASMYTIFRGLFNMVQLVGSPFWHRLSERVGRKPCMVVCYLLYALCAGGMGRWSSTFGGMLCWRALAGFVGVIHALMNTIASDLAPLKQRGTWLLFSMGAMISGSIFAGVGVVVMDAMGLTTLEDVTPYVVRGFTFCACLTLFWKESAPLVLARRQGKDLHIPISQTQLRERDFIPTALRLFSDRRFAMVFAAYVLALSTYTIMSNTGNAWLLTASVYDANTEEGRAAEQSFNALTIVVACTVGSINTFGLGRVFNKHIGERNVTYVGQVALFLGSVCRLPFPEPVSQWVWMLSAVLCFFGESLGHPSYIYLGATYASTHDRGSVLGAFQIGNSIGRSVLSIVHGFIFDYSWRLCLLLAAVYPCIAAWLMYMCPFSLTTNTIEVQAQRQREQKRRQAAFSAVDESVSVDMTGMKEDVDASQSPGERETLATDVV
ncbi:major facilitator superfamily protein [Kipferlia bialata]|uniref:Major facilitator superfamily protein n=1 Tax=Kipferlia bialata TaxID=797122 RepID=A0A9K3GGN6_9EUKA|nr:major facilitator superfamily protein [Kipferlia bialata]|eukprot:g4557.t1